MRLPDTNFYHFRAMATKWHQEVPRIIILSIFMPRPTNGPRRLPESIFDHFMKNRVGVMSARCSFAAFEIILQYPTHFLPKLRKGYIAESCWGHVRWCRHGARLQLLSSFYLFWHFSFKRNDFPVMAKAIKTTVKHDFHVFWVSHRPANSNANPPKTKAQLYY